MINKKRGILFFSIILFVIIIGYFHFQNRDTFNNIDDSERDISHNVVEKINENRSTYTGEKINLGGKVSSQLWTRTTIKGLNETIKAHADENIKKWGSKMIEDVKNSSFYPGWSDIHYKEQHTIENPNLIIVMMDKGVASSGETFIEILRSMKNVIFVGVNTNGMSLVGNNILYILPNSNMPVYFGKNLNLSIDLENLDVKGFYPDLWLNPNESLDRVLKFIERYDMDVFKKKL